MDQILVGRHGHKRESLGVATVGTCNPPILRWENLLVSLRSAVLLGAGENLPNCTLVKAEYMLPKGLGFYVPTSSPVGLVIREMCVDTTHNVISWERFEGDSVEGFLQHVIITVTYAKVERDPEFGVDEFEIPYALYISSPDDDIYFEDSLLLPDIDRLPVHLCSGCVKNPFAVDKGK